MPKWLKTQDETGLVEAKGLSDVKAIRKLHGNKSAYAYSIGRKMGMKNQY